jgi:XTP/dITP diphosphohydrolase
VIQPLPDFRAIAPCVEDGATFAENAIIKARHYGAHASGLLFADDSGLEVDALGGAPGVYSARFSGPGATDESNNRLLLEKLRGVEDRRRGSSAPSPWWMAAAWPASIQAAWKA